MSTVAAASMLLILVGSSLVVMAQREAQRVEQRTALVAQESSPTDISLRLGDDVWNGEQFPILWIEPAGADRPIMPPGMNRFPEPGEAVVSPALDQLASRHAALAARYPNRFVLNMAGVKSRHELIAYVRMPEDRSLSGDLAKGLSGDTKAVRVHAFGPPTSPTDVYFGLRPFSGMLSVSGTTIGVIGFLILPGFTMATITLATMIRLHGWRSDAPNRSTERQTRNVTTARVVFNALSPTVTGLIAATVTWGLLAPQLRSVPLVDHDVFQGDLKLPWWLLTVELTASTVIIVLLALVLSAQVTGSVSAPRRASIAPLEVILIAGAAFAAFAVAMLVLYWPVPISLGAMLGIGGAIAAIVSVLIVLPEVIRLVGKDLGRLTSVPSRIAARELRHNAPERTRPFLGSSTLIIVALVASGQLSSTSSIYASTLPEEPGIVFVEWLDPHPEDLDRFADNFTGGLVASFSEGGHHHDDRLQAHGHDHGSRIGGELIVGTTCRRLAPYFPSTECHQKAPYKLPHRTEHELAETLLSVAHGPSTEVRLVPTGDVAAGKAFVLDNGSLGSLERSVRNASMDTLPAPHVYSELTGVAHPTATVSWVTNGFVVALAVLAFAFLLSLGGYLSITRKPGWHLPNSTFSPRQCVAFEAWLFAAPFGTVIVTSLCAGLAVCTIKAIFLPDIPMLWNMVGITLSVAVVIGIAGTASAALLALRNAQQPQYGHVQDPSDLPMEDPPAHPR